MIITRVHGDGEGANFTLKADSASEECLLFILQCKAARTYGLADSGELIVTVYPDRNVED